MNNCEFCGHAEVAHHESKHECATPECKCAVYTEPGAAQETADFLASLSKPVTVTPREVANRIHRAARGGEHLDCHSCPCAHLALFYLGVADATGVFWPGHDGRNVWRV